MVYDFFAAINCPYRRPHAVPHTLRLLRITGTARGQAVKGTPQIMTSALTVTSNLAAADNDAGSNATGAVTDSSSTLIRTPRGSQIGMPQAGTLRGSPSRSSVHVQRRSSLPSPTHQSTGSSALQPTENDTAKGMGKLSRGVRRGGMTVSLGPMTGTGQIQGVAGVARRHSIASPTRWSTRLMGKGTGGVVGDEQQLYVPGSVEQRASHGTGCDAPLSPLPPSSFTTFHNGSIVAAYVYCTGSYPLPHLTHHVPYRAPIASSCPDTGTKPPLPPCPRSP